MLGRPLKSFLLYHHSRAVCGVSFSSVSRASAPNPDPQRPDPPPHFSDADLRSPPLKEQAPDLLQPSLWEPSSQRPNLQRSKHDWKLIICLACVHQCIKPQLFMVNSQNKILTTRFTRQNRPLQLDSIQTKGSLGTSNQAAASCHGYNSEIDSLEGEEADWADSVFLWVLLFKSSNMITKMKPANQHSLETT